MYIITHTPDGKCKNCTEDEDVVEHCQTYQKFVKSFTKFLPCHYNDGDGVAWIYSKLTLSLIKRFCDTLPSLSPPNTYQVFRQCQREKIEFLPPKRRKSIKKWKIVDKYLHTLHKTGCHRCMADLIKASYSESSDSITCRQMSEELSFDTNLKSVNSQSEQNYRYNVYLPIRSDHLMTCPWAQLSDGYKIVEWKWRPNSFISPVCWVRYIRPADKSQSDC